MKKIISIFSLLLVAVAIVLVSPSQGRLKPFYSGDAIAYQGKIVAASTNTGSLEVFSSDGQTLNLKIKQTLSNRFGGQEKFYDVKLDEANGHLYAYAVSNYTLYRYDISNLSTAVLDKKVSNTYWEWYNRVDKFGDNIVTVSAKSVKIWNADMEVIDSFKIESSTPYGVRGENSSQYIVSLEGNTLKVYDRLTRAYLSSTPVNFKNLDNGHRAELDSASGRIYLADDYYLKSFDLNGNLLDKYAHAGNVVYDTETVESSPYVYFSNGFGIYRNLKSDFKTSVFTNTINLSGSGSWAMGMKVVQIGGKDNIVVFNNNSILILDSNMKKSAQYVATETAEEDNAVTPQESLFLYPSKYWATPGETVSVSGGGFMPQETVTVSLSKVKASAVTDSSGRFSVQLGIPGDIEHEKRFDLSAVGQDSGLRFSTSFDIK